VKLPEELSHILQPTIRGCNVSSHTTRRVDYLAHRFPSGLEWSGMSQGRLKPVVTVFLYIKNRSKLVVAVPVAVFENCQKKTAGCSPGFPILDQKPDLTGLQNTTQLTSAQSPSTTKEIATMCHVPYHKAVGSLMYATLDTQPDICFAVQSVSRFNSKPGLVYWEAVKRIFRYLKGTRDLWLAYHRMVGLRRSW
jgi:hypothetical protein